MRIVEDFPPLFDEIAERFPSARNRGVIFSWGDIIYNPTGIHIDASLLAHEAVHGARQSTDIVGWWHRYIDDVGFRLAEEIPAHQAEYLNWMKTAHNRNERRASEKAIAARLAGPLYGRMITGAAARKLLKEAA